MRRATVAAIAVAGVLVMMSGLATPVRGLATQDLPALRALVSGDRSVRQLPRARSLPRVLYGVTADDVTSPAELVASARHLPHRPTTRIYFDVSEPPGYYAAAVRQLRPVSYLMGELLDSSDETRISVAAYRQRVRAYLAVFGTEIELWEIGNEVNGNWTGRYPTVAKKLTDAYREVKAAHKRTALTLYYNARCGDGAAELSPLAFSRRYVPQAVRKGLTHVFLSYYEGDCHGPGPPSGPGKTISGSCTPCTLMRSLASVRSGWAVR